MDDRKTVAVNLDGDEYSLALTIDQVKLLEWCREHSMFWDGVSFQVINGALEII